MRCSVVIPTSERPTLLARALSALAVQTLSPEEFEIIVCDDAGTVATRMVVDQWRALHGIHIAYIAGATRGQGLAVMRNAGWQAARSEVIAFTDDDTIPDPDWLRQGLVALGEDDADAASGRVVIPPPDEPSDYEPDSARVEEAGFVTANCFCRRRVLEWVGGFDPRFHQGWREDSDLLFKLIESGFDMVHALDAVVVRPVRPAPWVVSLRAESKHVFDALLFKKHPTLYAQFIRPVRPYLYYVILVAVVTAIGGLAGDSSTLAGVGFVAWLGTTAALVARRLRETKRSLAHVTEVIVTSFITPPLSVYHRVRGGVLFRVMFW